MTRNIFSVIFTALILVIMTGSCRNNKQGGQSSQGPVPVVAYRAHSENVVYYDDYPATVTALNEIQLRSEVNGYVTGVFFKEGGHVRKGEKLYEIDRRKFRAALDAARANLDIARSNLDKANRDAERYITLNKQDAIAKQILDDAITARENAKMQVKLAEANLLSAGTDYNYSLVEAPFSGLTGFSFVKPGAFVTAGQTLLTTISSDDPAGVDFNIDQKVLPYFLKLQEERITELDSVFRLVLPDGNNYKYNGKLTVIDRAIDPLTGTIKIRVVFQNDSSILRPGMNCRIKVRSESSGRHLLIPSVAVTEQMSENMVYIIKDNKVNQARIIPGPNIGKFLVVEEGLTEGDSIITEGIQNVRQGMRVRAVESAEMNKMMRP
jgi:RND family efflux transporter MFP subunit